MIDIKMIDTTITELERQDTTFANCQKLASLYVVRDHLKQDLVPESDIDEGIEMMLGLFVSYYNNKSVTTLKPLLAILNQVISELYHTCNTLDERQEMRNFITNINKIAT